MSRKLAWQHNHHATASVRHKAPAHTTSTATATTAMTAATATATAVAVESYLDHIRLSTHTCCTHGSRALAPAPRLGRISLPAHTCYYSLIIASQRHPTRHTTISIHTRRWGLGGLDAGLTVHCGSTPPDRPPSIGALHSACPSGGTGWLARPSLQALGGLPVSPENEP